MKPNIPRIITHRDLKPLLKALSDEPFFKCGSKAAYDLDAWYNQTVCLEVPTGELAKSGLNTMALVGRNGYETASLTGKEGFNAQGLEGKVVIRKPLANALFNMRDLIPVHRGRIITLGVARKGN